MTNEWMILQNWGKCKDCPKSVQPDAVKLTLLNVPWWQTNPLKSRPLLVGYTYNSGGSSTVGNTSCNLFWKCLEVSVSSIFSTFLNHSGEDKKSHVGEYGGWCTCGVWWLAKNCYTSSAKCPDSFHDEFACARLPFSWLCMANCIMEMSQHFYIKMLPLGIVFMVDKMNTVQILFDQTL